MKIIHAGGHQWRVTHWNFLNQIEAMKAASQSMKRAIESMPRMMITAAIIDLRAMHYSTPWVNLNLGAVANARLTHPNLSPRAFIMTTVHDV